MGYGRALLDRAIRADECFDAVLAIIAGCEEYALTRGERHFLRVANLVGQVGNGGFDQYFFNSGVWEAREALEALQAFGCSKMAALLQRAVEVIRLPEEVADDYRYETTAGQERALDALDTEFYSLEGEPHEQAVAYLREHAEEFVGAA